MGEVKLIGAWGSSMTWRVQMLLKMKGIEHEYVEEDLANKSPLLLQHNPVHKKVPVLLHNGKAIAESLVIIQYIEETWENGPSLLPKNPYDRAVARFWAKYFDETCIPAMLKASKTAGEEREKAKEEAIELLKFLDNEVKGKKFFGGDTIGLVDIALSFGSYWFDIISEIVGLELITKDKLPNLCQWIDEFVNHSFVKENLPDRGRLTQIFTMFLGSAAK
ncbi:putative glutathione S-transferase [Dorcoceras hygrometricum]|uniref:Probable glutathione S-transferase n=2 Tax=Dorcoceras hygrometricum TaxID=472368 RepID=A0A2Z7A9Y8_9LAMI|nr:putative glutathione S-transferase [Dorcoceras hygrometricum]